MGVYSLEAAEMYAAKNRPAINESFAPYENPILEYGIKSIRADFALFEAQLELDFKEYYDTLNEAEDKGKEEGGTTVNVNNTAPDPEFDAKKRAADNAQDKAEKEEADKEKAAQDASKGSKVRQTLGKMKIDSGTIAKFGEFIKKLWQNLVTSLTSMFNRLVGSFNKFADNNGEKFASAVNKIKGMNSNSYKGGDISIVAPNAVKAEFDKLIQRCYKLLKESDSLEIEQVESEIRQLDDDLKDKLAELHQTVGFDVAKSIIVSNADILNNNNFKNTAKKAYENLISAAKEKAETADMNYSKKVREEGQEAADKDSSLQIDKEKAQKISQIAGKIGAEYGKAVSSSVGSIVRAASGIVAYSEGKSLGAKVDATKEVINDKKNDKKNPGAPVNTMANPPSVGDDQGNKYANLRVNHASYSLEDDDLLTVSETANILQVMVEDVFDINFDECFEF